MPNRTGFAVAGLGSVLFGFGIAIQPYPIPPCCVGCEVKVSPGCQFRVDWSTANGLSKTIEVFGILIWLMLPSLSCRLLDKVPLTQNDICPMLSRRT